MRGGVVFRDPSETWFLPASIAMKVLPSPVVSPVPGGPETLVGMALVDGEPLPIVAVGHDRGAMLLVTCHGERLGIVGVEILATGSFPKEADDQVVWQGKTLRPFDVAALVARLHEGRWAV